MPRSQSSFSRKTQLRGKRTLAVEQLESRALLAVDYVVHISVDGLGGPYLEPLIEAEASVGGGRYANFLRLTTEGTFTYNARTDFTHTLTLPNHTSMLTGRPVLAPDGAAANVGHNWISNSDPPPNTTLHSNHPDVDYIASVFDVVHDEGLSTALYATKTKFSLFTTSYNEEHGAPDTNTTGGDNGRNKIDRALVDTDIDMVMDELVADIVSGNQANYNFFHSLIPDAVGHTWGWGTDTWNDWIRRVDFDLGRILTAVEASPQMNGRTAIILTTDHGGTSFSHLEPDVEEHYTIPFFVWGPDIPAGQDIYDVYGETTVDPGTGRPDYNAEGQPVRAGDSGNLALELLGLPNIPGSTIDSLTTCEGEECDPDSPDPPDKPDPPVVTDPPPRVESVIVNGGEQTPNRLHSLAFTFSKDVSASLGADDFSLSNHRTGREILLPASAKLRGVAEWRLTALGLGPGFYQATLDADGITDADGIHLDGNGDLIAGDSWHGIFVVATVGDANADGAVDTLDYTRMIRAPATPSWSDGDFDGNGTVDAGDLAAWRAARFTDLRPAKQPSGRTPRATLSQYRVSQALEFREFDRRCPIVNWRCRRMATRQVVAVESESRLRDLVFGTEWDRHMEFTGRLRFRFAHDDTADPHAQLDDVFRQTETTELKNSRGVAEPLRASISE